MVDDPGQVADAVAVAVGEAARIDLVDHAASATSRPRSGRRRAVGVVRLEGVDIRVRQRPSRSRRRATCSASSASRARAPSTTAAGARLTNASFARRSRAAASQPSASASSRSRRSRSRSAASSCACGRPDRGLDLAAAQDHRQVPGLRRGFERLGRQLAAQRSRAGESFDGGSERLEGRTERWRHVDHGLQPVGSGQFRLGARVPDLGHELDERPDLGLGAEVALAHSRPARDDEQVRVAWPGAAALPTAPRSRTASPGGAAAGTCRGRRPASTTSPRARPGSGARRPGGPWPSRGPSRSTRPRSPRRRPGSARRTRRRSARRRRPRSWPRPATTASARPDPDGGHPAGGVRRPRRSSTGVPRPRSASRSRACWRSCGHVRAWRHRTGCRCRASRRG